MSAASGCSGEPTRPQAEAEANISLYDGENPRTVVDEDFSPRRYRFDFVLR